MKSEERTCLADEAPPVAAREDLLAAVGEVLDLEEVLDLVEPSLDRLGDLGFVAPEPVEQSFERVDLLEWVEARVRADADRDRARGELDQPDPVALPADVVRAELADAALLHAAEKLLVVGVGPVLEVESAGEPEPGRVDDMPVVLQQPEPLLEREGAAGGVDHPACVRGHCLAVERERDPVEITAERHLFEAALAEEVGSRDLVAIARDLHVLDAGAPEAVDPGGECLLAEEVLEAPAVELVGVDRQASRRAALDALRQLAVVAGREPEAQAVLRDLLVLEVLLETEHIREVLARDLLKAASRAAPSRFSAMKMLVSGRACLSCRPTVNPARPPPRTTTS